MLKERIERDFKEAMKLRNEAKVSALRMLRASFKNKEIEAGHELSDEEVTAVIASQVKHIEDARLSYLSGGRSDLVAQADVELTFLKAYLPEPMGDDELAAIIEEVRKQNAEEKNVGKLIGEVVRRVKGRAEGAKVREMIEKRLAK